MVMSFSEREQRLLKITAILGALFILFMGWNLLFNQTGDAALSEDTAVHFEDLFAQMQNIETQKVRNHMLRKKLGNKEGHFASEKEIIQLIAEIEKVAGSSGVKMKNWDPNTNKRAKPLPRLDIRVTLECKFEQLIKFLDNIRNAKYICQPTSLRTKLKDPKKPDLDVTMTLTTYLLNAKPAPVSPSALAQR